MLPSAVDEATGFSESGTGNNHLPRTSRSRAAVPAPPSTTGAAPTAGGRVLCAPSSPNDLLNACSRARLVDSAQVQIESRGVNRPSTVTGTGAPIASRTGCNTSGERSSAPVGLSHFTRTGANKNGLPASGGVRLSDRQRHLPGNQRLAAALRGVVEISVESASGLHPGTQAATHFLQPGQHRCGRNAIHLQREVRPGAGFALPGRSR